MCKKQVALTVLSCVAICAALFGKAQAQLVKLPAVLFTIADCHPGDHWEPLSSHGGLLRYLTNNPSPAPTCPAGSTRTSTPVWNGEARSQPVHAVIPLPAPPSPLPGHVVVATATTNSCGILGVFNTYADGVYDAGNPDWSQSFSGTQDQMFSNGAAYVNQNYARYYQPMYIPQPLDPNTATRYLSRVSSVNNP